MADDDYWIEPDGIEDQARAFDAHAELMKSAATLVGNTSLVNADHGTLYNRGVESGRSLVNSLNDWFARLAFVLEGIAVELRATADEARQRDTRYAAEIDALDPTEYNGFTPKTPLNSRAGKIAPANEQPGDVTFPVYLPPNGGAKYYCDGGPQFEAYSNPDLSIFPSNFLSPSAWIDKGLSIIGGGSLKEDLTELFGGPWGDLFELVFVLNGLQVLLSESCDRLTSAVGALSVYWQGYSANSAQEYFKYFLESLAASATLCQDSADSFSEYTHGVFSAVEQVTEQVEGVLDYLLLAAIAGAFGTATIETLIGGAVGFSAGGLALLAAANQLKKVWDTMQNVSTLMAGLHNLKRLSSQLDDFTSRVFIPEIEITG